MRYLAPLKLANSFCFFLFLTYFLVKCNKILPTASCHISEASKQFAAISANYHSKESASAQEMMVLL